MSHHLQACPAGAAAAAAEKPVYEPAEIVRYLAHELRQPLSTIESIAFYVEMVLPRTEGKARRQLGKLQQQVHQINWILTDAIHFLQAAPLRLQLLDLSEVISKSLSEWDVEDEAGVCLRLESGLEPVWLDFEQTQHMLRNIVAFFGRICRPGRSIVIRTYAGDCETVLEMTAATVRYPAEEVAPFFEPFGSRLPGGSGLGLASVRRIAEAHRARVELQPGEANISLVIGYPARQEPLAAPRPARQ
jgi:signal transduction histidine kinase